MTDESKNTGKYTAITFAPVQGFIERSRKLRDLYGASLILSYLSQQIVLAVDRNPETTVISPANINIQKGMPNRILIRGDFGEDAAKEILLNAWKDILEVCRNWIETKLFHYNYEWDIGGTIPGKSFGEKVIPLQKRWKVWKPANFPVLGLRLTGLVKVRV
jgi:CRISPR-associated protein Cmr2